MNLLKLATIRNDGTSIDVLYDRDNRLREDEAGIHATGDEEMKEDFHFFVLNLIHTVMMEYNPYNWSPAYRIARMFADARDYEFEVDKWFDENWERIGNG